MTVGIVGLGLIGSSFARAYKENGDRVLAFDTDGSILGIAQLSGVIDGELTKDALKECELLLLALYPEAVIAYLTENAPFIGKDTLVMDTCGTKRKVCAAAFPLAEQYGFSFVGGHPMAGTQFSGFKHGRASLFKGASMILVPEKSGDIAFLDHIRALLAPAGFGRLTVTTAENHDRMIAFTSQLAHVVSSAYIKSPTAQEHRGFSAGSYKDLTRVAWLNEDMWTELFLENRDNLMRELDDLLGALSAYRDALEAQDAETLRELLRDGKQRKEQLDRASVKN